jgi:hypothetical protein
MPDRMGLCLSRIVRNPSDWMMLVYCAAAGIPRRLGGQMSRHRRHRQQKPTVTLGLGSMMRGR